MPLTILGLKKNINLKDLMQFIIQINPGATRTADILLTETWIKDNEHISLQSASVLSGGINWTEHAPLDEFVKNWSDIKY